MTEARPGTGLRPGNIASFLPRIAQTQPEALAVAVADRRGGFRRLTCAALDAACDRAAHALRDAGIAPGMRTVLMVQPSPEFFAITFALFKLGAVPVMVDPGMGIRNLGKCLAEADPAAFIGIPKAHLARRLFGWARDSVRIRITVGRALGTGGRSFSRLLDRASTAGYATHEPAPDETAAILFTSGSTGVPKGVVYTHEVFLSQVDLLRDVYGIRPGEVDLSTFPLFALFGPALGMASVVPRMDASRPATTDPDDLIQAIQTFACTNVFVNPSLVDILGRRCAETGTKLASVRRVLSAGAPASPPALERLQAALDDGVEIFTPYGATEALPVASVGSHTILQETRARTDAGGGVCVGAPVPGMDVAILPIRDVPIPSWDEVSPLGQGITGEIAVRGPVVTASYFGRPEATGLAKIPDGDRIWHRMGDVGYLDEAGRLWMCGRKSHRVETATKTLFTIPCEGVFNVHPEVKRTALVGVVRDGETTPVLCVEREAGCPRQPERQIRELLALGGAHPHTAEIRTVLFHRKFPVDVRHNAKIFREQLAVWAAHQLG